MGQVDQRRRRTRFGPHQWINRRGEGEHRGSGPAAGGARHRLHREGSRPGPRAIQTTLDQASNDAAGGSPATTGSASTMPSTMAATPRLNRCMAVAVMPASSIGVCYWPRRPPPQARRGRPRVTTTRPRPPPQCGAPSTRCAAPLAPIGCRRRMMRLRVALHHQDVETARKIGTSVTVTSSSSGVRATTSA